RCRGGSAEGVEDVSGNDPFEQQGEEAPERERDPLAKGDHGHDSSSADRGAPPIWGRAEGVRRSRSVRMGGFAGTSDMEGFTVASGMEGSAVTRGMEGDPSDGELLGPGSETGWLAARE